MEWIRTLVGAQRKKSFARFSGLDIYCSLLFPEALALHTPCFLVANSNNKNTFQKEYVAYDSSLGCVLMFDVNTGDFSCSICR